MDSFGIKNRIINFKTYDKPIIWDGNDVQFVIGIAGKGNEHLELLSKIAIICSEQKNVEEILHAKTEKEILDFFI